MKKEMIKIKPGRWVRVKWDDIGVQDSLVVQKEGKSIKVFAPFSELRNIDFSQIVSIGKCLTANSEITGL